MKNVIAAAVEVPGESDDAKKKKKNESGTTGQRARLEIKKRVSKMCLTAGVCVGVMGDPAGPRGNLQV